MHREHDGVQHSVSHLALLKATAVPWNLDDAIAAVAGQPWMLWMTLMLLLVLVNVAFDNGPSMEVVSSVK